MIDNRPVKTSDGSTVPLSQVQSGKIKATVTFDDYGFTAGNYYNVHYSNGFGCVFANGQFDLDTEIRTDVLNTLIWYKDE